MEEYTTAQAFKDGVLTATLALVTIWVLFIGNRKNGK